jgi:hypothetical protein
MSGQLTTFETGVGSGLMSPIVLVGDTGGAPQL